MIKIRLSISVLAALTALAVAGCGGGSSGSSSETPASLAAPGSLVYVEGNLKPTGELKSNVDAVAKKVGGIDNLGEFVVSELESSASDELATAKLIAGPVSYTHLTLPTICSV